MAAQEARKSALTMVPLFPRGRFGISRVGTLLTREIPAPAFQGPGPVLEFPGLGVSQPGKFRTGQTSSQPG